MIETRRATGDRFEQLIVGHPNPDAASTTQVRRGDHTSTVLTSEVFDRDEVIDILLHYVEHDTIPGRLHTRELDLRAGKN